MMTPDDIRAAAMDRINAVQKFCNATHIAHNDGVLRGLIWALTGKDPGTELTSDMLRVFTLLGIPATRVGDRVEYEDRGDQEVGR